MLFGSKGKVLEFKKHFYILCGITLSPLKSIVVQRLVTLRALDVDKGLTFGWSWNRKQTRGIREIHSNFFVLWLNLFISHREPEFRMSTTIFWKKDIWTWRLSLYGWKNLPCKAIYDNAVQRYVSKCVILFLSKWHLVCLHFDNWHKPMF